MSGYLGVNKPPKSTKFIYPNGSRRKGTVVSEIYMKASGDGGDYLFVIQTISYEKEPGKPYVRFGYYRKEHHEKKWRWGSQTTFHTDKKTTEKIIRKAIAKGILSI